MPSSPKDLPIILAAEVTDKTKVWIPLDDTQTATPVTKRISTSQLQVLIDTTTGGGTGLPEFTNIAALRAASSGTLTTQRCYVQGYTTAWDGGGGTFYLLDATSHAGTYDDNGWHIVDASGRLWARDASIILPIQFGVTTAATQSAAAAMTDQATNLQKFFDFWADPNATGRTGSRNQSLGWALRPTSDQWRRHAYVPPGYIRTDTTIELEGWASGTGTYSGLDRLYANTAPGELTMEGAVFIKYSVNITAFNVSFGYRFLCAPCNLRAEKEQLDVSGTLKSAWDQRSFTQTTTSCKYPEIAWDKASSFLTWAASTKYYKRDLVKQTLADGSTYLYKVTANHTSASTAPTHTSGTSINLLCLGMIQTPTVSGGGQFDIQDILAADYDVGIRIKSCGHMRGVQFHLEAFNFACQVMQKPDMSASRTYNSLYADVHIGQGYGCKIQFAQVHTPDVSGNGWMNGMRYYFAGFMPIPSGSFPAFGTDKSVYAFLSIIDPTVAGTYPSNGNEYIGVSLEAPSRTGNAEVVQACILYGKESSIDMRCDLTTYKAVRFGRKQKMAQRPSQWRVKMLRPGAIEDNGCGNIIEQYATTTGTTPHAEWSMANAQVQGLNGTATNAYVFPPAPVIWSTGVVKRGIQMMSGSPAKGALYHPGTNLWDFTDASQLPGFVIDFGDEASGNDWAVLEVEPTGNNPVGRAKFQIIDIDTGSQVNPQRYPSFDQGGGLHDPTGIVPYDLQTSYCNSIQTNWSSDGSGRQVWGIAPWIQRIYLAVQYTSTNGTQVRIRTNRPVYFRDYTTPIGVAYAPEHGVWEGGALLDVRDPSSEVSSQLRWMLNKGVGSDAALRKLYYATSELWVTGHSYTIGQLVAWNVSSGVGDIYRATTTGTASGTAPTNDVGVTWVLEATGVNISYPTDWVKVANRKDGQAAGGNITGSTTINFDTLGLDNAEYTLTGNITVTLSATRKGMYALHLKSDTAATRTITWSTTINGTTPLASTTTTIGAIQRFYYDGTNWFGL